MPLNYAEEIKQEDLIDSPLDWQGKGLQQTASGYGEKLITKYKVYYKGKLKRVYAICCSNVSSLYIIEKGKRLFLKI